MLRIVPDDTKFDFMRFRRVSFPASAVLSIVAICLYFFVGLHFGIDFVGGTLLEVKTQSGQPADLAKMRSTLGALALGDIQLQEFGSQDRVLIRIPQQPGGEAAQGAASAKVKAALGEEVAIEREEVVGPRISTEMLATSTVGLGAAILAILVYLWFRFEWQFALGAMIANVHDLVLTIGYMSLMQIDFDLSSIAALLTILGYSLNDTVVIGQLDAVALDHYSLDRDALAARAPVLRRARDPQLRVDHDLRRGAGWHLYVGLHCGADPDLSRRWDHPCRR
jgi:preprotein translocase subunit SecF